jgi:hypothetical protein
MSEMLQKKKRRKKQISISEQVQEEEAVQNAIEVTKVLEELAEEKKYVDIQVCPNCKSPLVRRVDSMVGDMSSWMGCTPPKYECRCGWRERTVLKATNKPTTIRDVALMTEANDVDNKAKGNNRGSKISEYFRNKLRLTKKE